MRSTASAGVVGKEGKIRQRATSGGLTGSWAGTIDSVNALVSDLVHPTSEMARVIGAVAKGDLSKSMALDIDGRRLRKGIFAHRQNGEPHGGSARSFASEVTRVGAKWAPTANWAVKRK